MSFLTLRSWKEFQTVVESVCYDAWKCLNIYNGFLQFKGKLLKSVLTNEIALKCFLGGFQGEEFVENSLYNFCKQLFGIEIDFQKLASLLKKADLQEASQFVEIQVGEREFIRRLKEFTLAVQQLGYTGYTSAELSDPRNYVENLANNLLRIVPNYNEHALFLVRTFRIAKVYLDSLYPESEYPERGSVLEYLGFRKILDPGGPEKIRKEYTIYGYPKGSLGWKFLKIVNTALDILTLPELRKYFPGLEDERKKFIMKVRDFVSRPNIPMVDRFDKLIQGYSERLYHVAPSTRKQYEYEIRKLQWQGNVTETPHRLYPDDHSGLRSCNFEAEVRDGIIKALGSTLDFSSFIDAIAPHMSVGLAFVDVIGDNKSRWWIAWSL